MPKRIGINIGFITNSSSAVHHFPKALLEDPAIRHFLTALEVEDGFVGSDMWSRDACTSLLITKEQKEEALQKLADTEYGGAPPFLDMSDDSVIVIFGDEGHGICYQISKLFDEACERLKISPGNRDEYN